MSPFDDDIAADVESPHATEKPVHPDRHIEGLTKKVDVDRFILSALHPDALHWHSCEAIESSGTDEEIEAYLERVASVNLNTAILVVHRYWTRDVCEELFGWYPARRS